MKDSEIKKIMIKTVFENTAYSYYPKGICSIEEREKYINSSEYNHLKDIINHFNKNEECKQTYKLLISEFNKHEILRNFKDISLLHWEDRSLSFELEIVNDDDNTLIKISLNISLLIPYYIVYVLENKFELEPYRWINLPLRNKKKERNEYKKLIELICNIVEKTTLFNLFPEDLTNTIVPEIQFQDIQIGEFTFFNAFFLNENKFSTK